MREVRDERELVRRCREGSEAAYAELVRSHRPRLYLLAYRLIGDRETAEDVVQETFLAAFRSIEKVDPRPSLSPWLNTIVLRTAGRAASRARSRSGSSLDQATPREAASGLAAGHVFADSLVDVDPGADPHAAAEAAELRRDLAAAMIDLPFKYRAAVVLRHVMGLDYAEAARELDLPLNTFKSHLLRGTKLLREALADRLEPEPAIYTPAIHVEPVAVGGNGHHRGELSVGSEPSLRRQPAGRGTRPLRACNLLPSSCHVCDVTNPHVGHALDCAHARELIDLFLLDDLLAADAARLAAHVKGCAACAAEIGGSTRVLGLLGSLPVPRPTTDLDERILLASLDDRARRRDRRSWLSDLRTQVIRGAMRTTGTLIVTIMTVALLGGAFVFAASQVVSNFPILSGPRATLPPVATPTTSVPAAQTAEPSTISTPRPSSVVSATPEVVITPSPTVEPTVSVEPSASPTPTPTPEPSATPTPEPSPTATAEPTPSPTPEPTASPTEKPRRTPPPSAGPSTPEASQPSP